MGRENGEREETRKKRERNTRFYEPAAPPAAGRVRTLPHPAIHRTKAASHAASHAMDTPAFTQTVLMYFVVPLWIAMGALDCWCHRRSDIARTSGPKESLIHLLMFAEVGVPMTAALLLEINALVIGLMIFLYFIHEATALWDVGYAVSRREVSPIEQHVHSHLELVPMMALLLVIVMHHEQFLTLFHLGQQAPSCALRFKAHPLPWPYLAAVFGGAGLFNLLPYAMELRAGLKARRPGRA